MSETVFFWAPTLRLSIFESFAFDKENFWERNFPSKMVQILPQAKWEKFPRPKKPPKISTEISPATTGSFACFFKVFTKIIIHLGVPGVPSVGVSAFHQPRVFKFQAVSSFTLGAWLKF